MRTVIQRVTNASVRSEGEKIGSIKSGLVVFLAIHKNDTEEMIDKLADKISRLRIFEDNNRKLNLSIIDTGGEILVVSQFTLYADCNQGNRPSFTDAADPAKAEKYYEKFIQALQAKNISVVTGKFKTNMQISLINDGPVTIILDL
ncbi:D-tyrosyl-tRNA(Tyr) deacylase [Candidatus Falkowbacteria bacterium]|nr:MAG: D-tyrosyl-tRNA(Tyr) deacylase [Candidatus Falkowbacteria bacterium]